MDLLSRLDQMLYVAMSGLCACSYVHVSIIQPDIFTVSAPPVTGLFFLDFFGTVCHSIVYEKESMAHYYCITNVKANFIQYFILNNSSSIIFEIKEVKIVKDVNVNFVKS